MKSVETQTTNDRYLTEQEAAVIDGMSLAWHRRCRWAGNGPPFVKLGNAVRYKESSLRAWMDARTQLSTTKAV
jgi:predicted DNA-binding transcriptional regulator AlpA